MPMIRDEEGKAGWKNPKKEEEKPVAEVKEEKPKTRSWGRRTKSDTASE